MYTVGLQRFSSTFASIVYSEEWNPNFSLPLRFHSFIKYGTFHTQDNHSTKDWYKYVRWGWLSKQHFIDFSDKIQHENRSNSYFRQHSPIFWMIPDYNSWYFLNYSKWTWANRIVIFRNVSWLLIEYHQKAKLSFIFEHFSFKICKQFKSDSEASMYQQTNVNFGCTEIFQLNPKFWQHSINDRINIYEFTCTRILQFSEHLQSFAEKLCFQWFSTGTMRTDLHIFHMKQKLINQRTFELTPESNANFMSEFHERELCAKNGMLMNPKILNVNKNNEQ